MKELHEMTTRIEHLSEREHDMIQEASAGQRNQRANGQREGSRFAGFLERQALK
jgi:hypothetical protein